MKEVVFLLEEPSARALLEGLIERLNPSPGVHLRFIVFEGKRDLENSLLKKIRGYQVPGASFIVMRDQDSEDCVTVRKRLMKTCHQSGKSEFEVKIACREIESWYLADLAAVQKALHVSGLATKQNKGLLKNPDDIHRPSEELIKLTEKRYQKIDGSRRIACHLDLHNVRSRSFSSLIKTLHRVLEL